MAYSVNWSTRVVSIPKTDLVFVADLDYELNSRSFLEEIRRLEWDFNEGLAYPQILDYTASKNISNTDYSPFDEIINGYMIEFDDTIDRVTLRGSNTNIADRGVIVNNGVLVVPTNSAGNTIITTSGTGGGGSGLTAEDRARLVLIEDHSRAANVQTKKTT